MIVNPAEAIPAPRNAAFPGAVLMFIGAYLLYWALAGWGLFGKAKPNA